MYTRPASPQNLTGVLDDGFRLYIASLKTVLPLSFIGGLIGALPQLGITLMGENPELPELGPTLIIIGVAAFLLVMLASGAFYIGVVSQMESFAAGRPLPAADALMQGLPRLLPVIGASILFTLGMILGMVLLVVPGIIISTYWVLFMATAVIDGKGPVSSLTYSYHLIRGSWWRVAVIFTVVMLIYMVVYSIFMVFLIGGVIGGMSATGDVDTTYIDLVTLIVAPLMSAFLGPFFVAFLLVLRHDLKMRKEGSDLAARIDSTVAA